MFGIRSIIEDYETHLRIVDIARAGASAKGKSEWERYGNGETEFSVRIRNVDLNDDSILNVYLEKQFVGQITIKKRKGTLRIESRNGNIVPSVTEGTLLTILLGSSQLFEGKFIKD